VTQVKFGYEGHIACQLPPTPDREGSAYGSLLKFEIPSNLPFIVPQGERIIKIKFSADKYRAAGTAVLLAKYRSNQWSAVGVVALKVQNLSCADILPILQRWRVTYEL